MARQRGLNRPSVQRAFATSRVNIPDAVESIYQPLYDYQTLAATAVASQSFFQVPVGQSSKTIADTNMSLAGQLPKGQTFQITGIQVEILPTGNVDHGTGTNFGDDCYAVYKAGALVLTIGSKDYVTQGNLMKFPPINRMAGVASTGLVTQQIQYFTAAGREYSVADLLLESSQNFSVTILELPALPSAAAGVIGVTLNGFLFRNAQ